MKLGEIKVGCCYRTHGNWIRYVEQVEEGKVKYRSRNGDFRSDWTSAGSSQYQKLTMFAFDVVERVEANWEQQGDAATPDTALAASG